MFKRNKSSSVILEPKCTGLIPSDLRMDSNAGVAFQKLQNKDITGAIPILDECVKTGDRDALWMMGICFEYGMGVPKDIERAVALYNQSKDLGSIIGKFMSGLNPDFRGKLEYSFLLMVEEELLKVLIVSTITPWTSLTLNRCKPGSDGFDHISELLMKNSSLTSLSLISTVPEDHGCQLLAYALTKKFNIEETAYS